MERQHLRTSAKKESSSGLYWNSLRTTPSWFIVLLTYVAAPGASASSSSWPSSLGGTPRGCFRSGKRIKWIACLPLSDQPRRSRSRLEQRFTGTINIHFPSHVLCTAPWLSRPDHHLHKGWMNGSETEEETTVKFMAIVVVHCSGTQAQLVRITFLLLIFILVNHFNALHRSEQRTGDT